MASQPERLSALRMLRLVDYDAPVRLSPLGKLVLGEVVSQESRSDPQHRSDCRCRPLPDIDRDVERCGAASESRHW